MKRIIKIGTRESDLAVYQSRWVSGEIVKKHPDMEFQLVPIKTRGDIILDTRLDKIGGKGLFIKELETALLNGEVDIAVHSMKDMPAEIPDGLTIAAVSAREDPRDVLVSAGGQALEELKEGSVIGTSSIRREVQILNIRQDVVIKTLRGNVLTRLKKLPAHEYDAVVLAAAGLKRLGLDDRITQYFDVKYIIPAVGQGALCIEARKDDDLEYLIDSVHCEETRLAVDVERAFMIRLNGGCSTPLGAHAVIEGEKMKLFGMYAPDDMTRIFRECVEGSVHEAVQLGTRLAEMILSVMSNCKK